MTTSAIAISAVKTIATYGVRRRGCTRPKKRGRMPSRDMP